MSGCLWRTYSLWGSNPRPMAHKTIALTTELREHLVRLKRAKELKATKRNSEQPTRKRNQTRRNQHAAKPKLTPLDTAAAARKFSAYLHP